MSKILVLSGSPRKEGNSALMVQAFAEAATEKGHEVNVVETAFLKIGGCRACNVCQSGKPCVQKDDMTDVIELAKQADALVVASPMYFYGLTGQLKCCYDRLHAMGESNIKKTGMLLCAADESTAAFDGVVAAQKANAAFDHWEYVGEVRAVGVYEKGDVKNTKFLDEARAFADKF